ncbi:RNA-directed DNA polymerase from mobile element jockey [Portunus trituberculatus]|uniref:RNA-directed DNA polymerase from mobile element jockey n=1 Tax=Portunus trituberculatus TaxID=210409 RepID=A0A5B7H8T3_PORTR|nr:RNA-directed DNA polymerase from mobile element jockey [Portunus trituberculatus]
MGDFNAHHQCWDPGIPEHLSLLSPPGLATRINPHTGAPSVLDLYFRDPRFTTATFTIGPHMGSDHLPLLASIPNTTPRPRPGCLPRWNMNPSLWPSYKEALQTPPSISSLPLEEVVQSLGQSMFEADPQNPLDDQQKAEALAKYYHSQLGAPPKLHLPQDPSDTITAASSSPGIQELTQPFTPQELTTAMATLHLGKATGPDSIPYEFLTHLTPPLCNTLLHIYNTSWLTGHYPTTWKCSTLIPIPKPGKDPTLPSAYHPIALLSCPGKLMEHLVSTRLTWWLEEKRLLLEEQSVFRPHRNTLDVLSQVEHLVTDTYQRQNNLQEAATTLSDWVHTWDLTINVPKSALMCFTYKRILTPPSVHIYGEAVPYTTSHSFLGLHLDGPRLTWAKHMDYLRNSCTKRITVMKRIAGIRWGASRDLLLKYYQTTIRAKIMYGNSVYGSAAPSTLAKLDTLQNGALCIAMGAMTSSPIPSLLAESGIPPLSSYRREVLCKEFHRLQTLPPSYPLSILHSTSGVDPHAPVWPNARPPLQVRAMLAHNTLGLPPPPPQPISPHSSLPPWTDISSKFALTIPELSKHLTATFANTLFLQLDRTIYHHHHKIYTDGSHSLTPPATASAIYSKSPEIRKSWGFRHSGF